MPKTLTHEDLIAKAGPLSQEELATDQSLTGARQIIFLLDRFIFATMRCCVSP